MRSLIERGDPIQFPVWRGTQLYMAPFVGGKLPPGFEAYAPGVAAMLTHILPEGPVFVTIDEKELKAGQYHRRPGAHVDGVWNHTIMAHGKGHHIKSPVGPAEHIGAPGTVVLASSAFGCVFYPGELAVTPGGGGSLEHATALLGKPQPMKPCTVYAVGPHGIHESVPVLEDCRRSLIRLSVGEW